MPATTWALLIVTYNRPEILPQALKLACEQSRRPQEIVVVDASDGWEATRTQVLDTLGQEHSDLRWSYVPADVRSISYQRGQAVALADSDVVCLYDDDTFMFPDCAEELLRVYDADAEGEIAGVQATASPTPPGTVGDLELERKTTGHSESSLKSTALAQWLYRYLFLMNAQELFIPYDGEFPDYPLPPGVRDLDVVPTRLMQGFRMSFRRSVVAQEGFERVLRYYTAGEDLDISYRASRHGLLVTAERALVHHAEVASGRVSRQLVSTLSALNQAVLLRKHSSRPGHLKRRYFGLMGRRLVAEVLKDGLSRRLTFPQVRGLVRALPKARRIFGMSVSELDAWYPPLQQDLHAQLKGRR